MTTPDLDFFRTCVDIAASDYRDRLRDGLSVSFELGELSGFRTAAMVITGSTASDLYQWVNARIREVRASERLD